MTWHLLVSAHQVVFNFCAEELILVSINGYLHWIPRQKRVRKSSAAKGSLPYRYTQYKDINGIKMENQQYSSIASEFYTSS